MKQEIIMVGADMSKASLVRGSVSENQELGITTTALTSSS